MSRSATRTYGFTSGLLRVPFGVGRANLRPLAIAASLAFVGAAGWAQAPDPLPAGFDTSASMLAPNALTPIETLIRRFGQAPKGEFETTAAYRARLAAEPAPSGWFAVPGLLRTAAYDADGAKLVVSLPFDIGSGVGAMKQGVDGCGVTAKSQDSVLGSYEASNAAGAKITVTQVHRQDWAVLLPRKKREACNPWRVSAPVPADQAQQLKPHLAIALIVHPAPGPDGAATGAGTYQETPTFQIPRAGEWRTDWLVTDYLAVWLYDSTTGAVALKRVIGTWNPTSR